MKPLSPLRAADPVDVPADPAARTTAVEVVGCSEPGEWPQPPRQARQVVDVDEPLVGALAERVVQRHTPRVADLAHDEGREGRQVEEAGHHVAPNRAAASTPERLPGDSIALGARFCAPKVHKSAADS